MKSSILRLLVTALLAIPCSAQNLEFRGRETLTAPPSNWITDGEQPFAQIHYAEAPGETTLLFAHVTIDPDSATAAKGILDIYPFFAASDSSWNTGNSVFASLPITFTGPQQEVFIPPDRLAGHLASAFGENLTTDWGTHNSGPSTVTRQLGAPATWFNAQLTALSNHDERRPWANPDCWYSTSADDIVDINHLGRRAVEMAAWWHIKFTNINLDQSGLDKLDEYLKKEVGFVVNIQAAHIKPTNGGEGVEIRLTQRIKIRRRSLGQVQQDPWWVAMGPEHFLPSIVNGNEGIYLGARGNELHVEFPTSVDGSGLRALMLVDSPDGWVWMPQLTNPSSGGQVLNPEVGVFACPTNALSGVVYFFDATDQLVVPVHSVNFGAYVSAYDPD